MRITQLPDSQSQGLMTVTRYDELTEIIDRLFGA
jgi:hypothetical protein